MAHLVVCSNQTILGRADKPLSTGAVSIFAYYLLQM